MGPHSARRTSKVSLSEPESRMLRTAGDGSVQGCNAQVAADAGPSGLIVGQHLSDETTDYGLVGEGVTSVVAGAGQPTMVLVDKGSENSELIARVEETHQLMILCPLRHRPHTQEHPAQRRGRKRVVFALRQKMPARLADPSLPGALSAACSHRRAGLRPHQKTHRLYPAALLGSPRGERRMDPWSASRTTCGCSPASCRAGKLGS